VNRHNRAHFFGIAAHAARPILADHAKSKHREQRGGRSKLPVNWPTPTALLAEKLRDDPRFIDLMRRMKF